MRSTIQLSGVTLTYSKSESHPLSMNVWMEYDSSSLSNRSVNPVWFSLHGVAVSPKNFASGHLSHSSLYVFATAWCASSTITTSGLNFNS